MNPPLQQYRAAFPPPPFVLVGFTTIPVGFTTRYLAGRFFRFGARMRQSTSGTAFRKNLGMVARVLLNAENHGKRRNHRNIESCRTIMTDASKNSCNIFTTTFMPKIITMTSSTFNRTPDKAICWLQIFRAAFSIVLRSNPCRALSYYAWIFPCFPIPQKIP